MATNTAEDFRELAALARRLADGLRDGRTFDRLHQVADEYDKEAADLTAETRANTERLVKSGCVEDYVPLGTNAQRAVDVQTAFCVRA